MRWQHSDTAGSKPSGTFGRAGLMLFNAIIGRPEFSQTCAAAGAPAFIIMTSCRCLSLLSPAYSSVWCWGCKGYLVLTAQRGDQSWHVSGAFAAARLGPVVAALLFAGAGRVGIDGGNRPDAATGSSPAMEMMAVDPLRRVFRRFGRA